MVSVAIDSDRDTAILGKIEHNTDGAIHPAPTNVAICGFDRLLIIVFDEHHLRTFFKAQVALGGLALTKSRGVAD